MAKWTRDLEIGVQLIDGQHKELIDKLDALLKAMKQGQGKDTAVSLIPFFIEYARKHFLAEEGLMKLHAYPGLERHKKAHATFRKEFKAIEAALAEGRVSGLFALELQAKLSQWLLEHIKTVDKEMGAYLYERGAR